MIQTNQTGKSQSDNIIDELLTFNESSTWNSVGTGSATVSVANYFNGSGSLYIENNIPGQDLTVSNSTQATTIGIDGSYWLSLVFYKNLPDIELEGEVQIFKNSVIYNTQTFTFGSETTADDTNEIWARFVADQPFTFTKQDVVTFSFKINGITAYTLPSSGMFIDGIKLERNDANNPFPTAYSAPERLKALPAPPLADGDYKISVVSGVVTWTTA